MKLRRRVALTENLNAIMTTKTNPEVLAICYAQGWCASPNYMTKEEAEAVTSIGIAFKGSTTISHFEELKYFTGLTEIPANAFNGLSKAFKFRFPPNITSIGASAFYNTALTPNAIIDIPEGVTSVGAGAFNNQWKAGYNGIIKVPSTLTTIGAGAFYVCSSISASNNNPGPLVIWNSPIPPNRRGNNDSWGPYTGLGSTPVRAFDSDVYDVIDDMLIKDGDTLFAVPTRKTDAYYPSCVTKIADSALCNNKSLGLLDFPDRITVYGNYSHIYSYLDKKYLIFNNSNLVTIKSSFFNQTEYPAGVFRGFYFNDNTIWDTGLISRNANTNSVKVIVMDCATLNYGAHTYSYALNNNYTQPKNCYTCFIPSSRMTVSIRAHNIISYSNWYVNPYLLAIPSWFDNSSELTITLGMDTLLSWMECCIFMAYEILSITEPTLLINDVTNVDYMAIDGIWVTPTTSYTFSTKYNHNVCYIFHDATNITSNLFQGCTTLYNPLQTIASPTTISSNAFKDCLGMLGVDKLLANVTTIANGAFEGCYFINASARTIIETINPNAFGNLDAVNLPSGYTELTNVTADRNYYIDTGITPNNTICFDTTVYNLLPTMHIMGGKVSDSSGLYRITIDSSNKIYYFVMGNNTSNNYALTAGNNYRIRTIRGLLWTDDTYRTRRDSTWSGTQNLYLFALNTNGTVTLSTNIPTLGRTRIAKNEVLVRDYIPCSWTSGSTSYTGMYEQINGTTHILTETTV